MTVPYDRLTLQCLANPHLSPYWWRMRSKTAQGIREVVCLLAGADLVVDGLVSCQLGLGLEVNVHELELVSYACCVSEETKRRSPDERKTKNDDRPGRSAVRFPQFSVSINIILGPARFWIRCLTCPNDHVRCITTVLPMSG